MKNIRIYLNKNQMKIFVKIFFILLIVAGINSIIVSCSEKPQTEEPQTEEP